MMRRQLRLLGFHLIVASMLLASSTVVVEAAQRWR
jgi:hypothetical protein